MSRLYQPYKYYLNQLWLEICQLVFTISRNRYKWAVVISSVVAEI